MHFEIFGVHIAGINYSEMLDFVLSAIANKDKKLITYVTAASLNSVFKNPELRKVYSKFDLIHPDGIGVYLALRFLYRAKGAKEKITGSDFYPLLEKEIVRRNLKIFFFGDTKQTLRELRKRKISKYIVGVQDGFYYDTNKTISEINSTEPDILFVGLSSPKQEIWVTENYLKLNANIIICVGEGIKVFAGTKKRGAGFIRKIGLEWLIRLIHNPKKFWKRYLIGIPLFIVRIIILKLQK